jgi:hypothetical protein
MFELIKKIEALYALMSDPTTQSQVIGQVMAPVNIMGQALQAMQQQLARIEAQNALIMAALKIPEQRPQIELVISNPQPEAASHE